MKIGIDIMGGDYAPTETVKGAISAHKILDNDVSLTLFGDKEQIVKICSENNYSPENFEIVHTSQVIEMHEHPARAFQSKQDSSIYKGFEYLVNDRIDAFSSVGNTGAMSVGAIMVIKPVEGIIRPCISTVVPKIDGKNAILLDVGLNADAKPEMLLQYAILGSIYVEEMYHIKNPKVGLLNIGSEEGKGNILTQSAYHLMKKSNSINFIGNIEGSDIFRPDIADIIVTDGFTGNIVLKLTESFYKLLGKRNINDDYFNKLNFELYGGMPILGIKHPVMVGHGVSKEKAVKNMILHSVEITNAKMPEKITTRLMSDNTN